MFPHILGMFGRGDVIVPTESTVGRHGGRGGTPPRIRRALGPRPAPIKLRPPSMKQREAVVGKKAVAEFHASQDEQRQNRRRHKAAQKRERFERIRKAREFKATKPEIV